MALPRPTHLLTLLSALALTLAQQGISGVASVVDGDTLEIQGVRARLWGCAHRACHSSQSGQTAPENSPGSSWQSRATTGR